jgi:pyruvate kinase
MKTTIIATLGPASREPATMEAMVREGVRVFRLNFSHGDAASFADAVRDIRAISARLDIVLTVLADLSGPKIRVGELDHSPAHVVRGQEVLLGPVERRPAHDLDALFLPFDHPVILSELKEGDAVHLSDGMLRFTVVRCVEPGAVFALRAINGGLLTSHKGIAFPGKFISIPALTDKDRVDLVEALDLGVDAVAMSFVQSGRDILDLRDAMEKDGRVLPIIAKMEQRAAYDNLQAVLEAADCLMVARGDLGVQCPLPELPIMQKTIIDACRAKDKPVIVATQMLISMVDNPAPTRPETTDVANAILDGADAVMLSEETAIGKHPVEVVEYMASIAQQAEAYGLKKNGGPLSPEGREDPERTLAYCACLLADQTDSTALVCHTRSGTTALRVSGRRPVQPIYALSPNPGSLHMLNLSWGVIPRLVDRKHTSHLRRCEAFVQACADFAPGQSVVITAGQKTPGRMDLHTNEVKVYYKG